MGGAQDGSVWRMLRRSLATNRERPAVRCGTRSYSYAELGALVGALHRQLAELGVQRGDRVGLLLPNGIEFVVADLAVQSLGAVKVPLNSLLSPSEVAEICRFAGARALLSSDELTPLRSELAEPADGGPHVVTVAVDELDRDAELPPADNGVAGDSPSVIYFTGGTTGAPKGIVHSQDGVVQNLWAHLLESGIGRDDRVLVTTPLPHAAGLFTLASLLRGACVRIGDGFDPAEVMATADAEDITWTFAVPTMIYRLLDAAAASGWDGGSLHTVQYGAAPISAERLREGIERFGPVFQQLYAQTECPNYGTVLRKEDHVRALDEPGLLASCGRASIMCDVAVLGEYGAVLGSGEVGEVALRSPYTMSGYWGDAAAGAARFERGWLRTGDIGRLDDEGFLYLVDRRNDVIISGGMNVYSVEVERALMKHPSVRLAAAVGIPHADWGEAVHAAVEVDDPTVRADDLVELCRIELARYKVPKSIEFVAALPLTKYGKVDKVAVRGRHWESSARAIN